MPNIAGVDMGFSGAIAILNNKKEIVEVLDMPIIVASKTELNEQTIKNLLVKHKVKHAYLERAQTMPKQGVSSSGRYMMSYGIIRGICTGTGIPYTTCTPQSWKKTQMAGMGKEKNASILRCQQLYPDVALPLAKDHGKADAILIARHGIQHLE